jgi:predicted kinase
MPTPPNTRSVKISDDERVGWSSDRPRREGTAARPMDVSVRCRVLTPADTLRYSPGSLVVVVSPAAEESESFAERLVSQRGALLSLGKVRALLAGRVDAEEVAARAQELLEAAARKRLDANESVVIATDGLGAGEREPYVRMAAQLRRPRHVILVEPARAEMSDEDRAALTELRRRIVAGDMGAEGFQTALRVAGTSISEVKRINFAPPPRDD